MSQYNQYNQQGQPPYQQYGQQQPPPPQPYNLCAPQAQGPPPTQQWNAQPPAQQQWNAPPPAPQNQYGPPQTQQWIAPPAGQGYQPPPPQNQQWNAAPPPPQGHQWGPVQGQYPAAAGAPPAQNWNAPPPPQFGGPAVIPTTYLGTSIHPSDNALLPKHEQLQRSVVVDNYDPQSIAKDCDLIRKATKGFGTDETLLTNVLVPLTAVRIPPLCEAYRHKHAADLSVLLDKELRGNYLLLLTALIRGPLRGDLSWLEKATKGLGTNESLLTDLVIGRHPSSLELLRAAYNAHATSRFDLTILDELSFKTKDAFHIALQGEWKDQPNNGKHLGDAFGTGGVGGFGGGGFGQPVSGGGLVVNEQMVQQDLAEVLRVLRPLGTGTDTTLLASIFFARSPVHLNRLQQLYLLNRKAPLTRHVKANVQGHLCKALLYALEGGKKDVTGCWRDAKMIYKTMEGLGTKDVLLITRILRAHWDRPRFQMVKQAFQAKYHTTLDISVMKETSGYYRDALMAIINSPAY